MESSQELYTHLNFPVVFRPEPEGGFTVTVPSLAGCITYGKDLTEAKRMVQEAIELYLEDLIAEGEPLPNETDTLLATINVTLPPLSVIHA